MTTIAAIKQQKQKKSRSPLLVQIFYNIITSILLFICIKVFYFLEKKTDNRYLLIIQYTLY